MAGYPYAQTKKSLKGTIDKMVTMDVPVKVDEDFFSSIGFSNPNDLAVVKVLRFLNFVDKADQPTPVWRSYRNPEEAKLVMANAIRTAYSDLFAQHPNANVVTNSELSTYFAANTNSGPDVVRKTVSTFITLCEYADFGSESDSGLFESNSNGAETRLEGQNNGNGIKPPALPDQQPALHIDIQIHISPSADADQIDNIFRSMAKHLYSIDAS